MISIEALYQIFLHHPSVQTDTRKLRPGDIFFALKGPNFNGNTFIQKALEEGAAYVVADEPQQADERILQTDDTLSTLQALAKHHRQQLNIPVIAITGSNGKTTTKELVHAVLSKKYTTSTTEGNLNNHIGIPLTLLRIKKDAQIAVVEMGANHLKEIEGYCQYTLPTHGIITNCGKAHLEGFGSLEGVRKGKGELYDFLRANNGTAFVYDDYDYLRQMSAGIKNIVSYGTENGLVQGTLKHNKPFVSVQIKNGGLINTQLVGGYNLPNILCAAAVGKYFNVPDGDIKQAIEGYNPSNNRSQLVQSGTNYFITDAYNANPTSMRAAIENMVNMRAENKILMLGAMRELGEDSVREHQQLADFIAQHPWKNVVLVGGDFAHIAHNFIYFDTAEEAASWLKGQNLSGSFILVKGSRGISMEKVLE